MELKPDNVPIKEWLVKGIADSLNIPERVVATIVDFQFSEARESLLTCNSIEFSGFGKFVFNKRKAVKKMEKINRNKEGVFGGGYWFSRYNGAEEGEFSFQVADIYG